MTVTMYPHVCRVCQRNFTSRYRAQKTCGTECRGRAGGISPTKLVCECGKPARSKRGFCVECVLERKRQSRRDFYARHYDAIREDRRAQYAANAEVRAKINATTERARFNGLRIERLKLDKYTCQHCESRNQLVVHHRDGVWKKNRRDPKSTIHDLLTLCRKCHMNLHRSLGDLRPNAVSITLLV